jgi:hypothetical protein
MILTEKLESLLAISYIPIRIVSVRASKETVLLETRKDSVHEHVR